MTAVLHMLKGESLKTVEEVKNILNSVWKTAIPIKPLDNQTKIIDLIYSVANNILPVTATAINLENKLVLSIAIRLKAEEFMILKINNKALVDGLEGEQTAKLFSEYRKLASATKEEISLLNRINIMTPENIHVNSFMYEPILDLSDEHLRKLYQDISALRATLPTV